MQSVSLGGAMSGVTDQPAGFAPRRVGAAFLRPRLSTSRLTLYVSLGLALLYNAPFWTEMFGLLEGVTVHNLLFVVSLLVLLVAAFNLILSLVAIRYVLKPAVILVLALSALAAYYIRSYGILIDSVMIQNVFETDTREVADLLTPKLFLWILLLGVLPSVLVYRSRIEYRPWARELKLRAVAVLLSFVAMVAAVVPFYADYASIFPQQRQLRHMITPSNFIYGTAKYVRESFLQGDALGGITPLGSDAHLIDRVATKGRKTVVILVVGETARAQQFSLNGYARETNPVLSREAIFDFDNVSSCGTSTAIALPCIFSREKRQDYDSARQRHSEGLLDVLAHAGVSVLWRENNTGCKGACDRVETQEIAELWDDDLCASGECFDEVLLNGLDEYLESAASTAVIVLHQQGSHGPAYYRRYPDAFARFQPACTKNQLQDCEPQEVVNAYDNTILYTDYFLGRVIEFLQSRDADSDTAMLYVSDHGESLGERNVYLHGLPYFMAPGEQTRVPFITWLSDGMLKNAGIDAECLITRRSEALSHDNIFHSVLGLTEVETSVYDEGLDVFAGCRTRGSFDAPGRTTAEDTSSTTAGERG